MNGEGSDKNSKFKERNQRAVSLAVDSWRRGTRLKSDGKFQNKEQKGKSRFSETQKSLLISGAEACWGPDEAA